MQSDSRARDVRLHRHRARKVSDPFSSVRDDDLRRDEMLIDCATCEMRDVACDDCVITVLLGSPPQAEIADEANAALAALAHRRLLPPPSPALPCGLCPPPGPCRRYATRSQGAPPDSHAPPG